MIGTVALTSPPSSALLVQSPFCAGVTRLPPSSARADSANAAQRRVVGNLLKLPAFVDDKTANGSRVVRCVVEAPMGSSTKFKYDPETKAFVMGPPLIKGLTYPYDWGFIPGTVAEDEDPLDVMVVHDCPSFSGLVILSQVIGVLEVLQFEGKIEERNDRIFSVPVKSRREHTICHVDDIGARVRHELERFFSNTASLSKKELKFLGWKGPKTAMALIEMATGRYRKRHR